MLIEPSLHGLSSIGALLDAVPAGLAVYDSAGFLVRANAALSETLGVSGDAIRPGISLDETGALLAMAGLFPVGTVFGQSGEWRRQDGVLVNARWTWLDGGEHVLATSRAGSGSGGEVEQRAGILDAILHYVPHGISVYGPDRRLLMFNPAYAEIMQGAPLQVGETVEQVIRRRAEAGEFGPGDPEQIVHQQLARDLSLPDRRRRQRPNGMTIDIRTAPLPDGGHLSVVTDVTPLAAAEAELARRAGNMDAMLANIRHGIVFWDADSRIVACNPVVEQLLEAPPGLMVPGRSLDEVIRSAHERGNLGEGAMAEARARTLRERDRALSHMDQRLTRHGRVLEVRTDPAPDGGFVTTYTDVTSIREAEEALRQAKLAAEAANAGKSRFLAALSQELHTPLQAIIEAATSLARAAKDAAAHPASKPLLPGTLDPASTLQAADSMLEAARQLRTMTGTILDVARLEAGRFDLAPDIVDIGQLVRSCVRQWDAAAAAAEIVLVAEVEDGLPPIRGDARRLRQALGHLVANAVKFTSAAGTVRIVARRNAATGGALLEVEDTGGGIPAAELDRMFEPFARLGHDRAGQSFGHGAGLGLYVTRALLRAHGGDVTLHSEPGQGTRAVMHLPAARVLTPGTANPT